MITKRLVDRLERVDSILAVENSLRVVDREIEKYERWIETCPRYGLDGVWHKTIRLLKAARAAILREARRMGVRSRDLSRKEVEG